MGKFIEWMKNKEYNIDITFSGHIEGGVFESIPIQMQVGYMLEYLMERYENLEDVDLAIGEKIEEFYDSLKKNIEELDA